MPYADATEMTRLFGADEMLHLTNLYDPDATEIDRQRVDSAAEWADSIINTYLAQRYALPFTSTPLVLIGYAADITRYQLDSISPRDDVRQRYEDAIAWLKLVAAGKVNLGLDELGAETEQATDYGQVSVSKVEPAFTDDSLSGFL